MRVMWQAWLYGLFTWPLVQPIGYSCLLVFFSGTKPGLTSGVVGQRVRPVPCSKRNRQNNPCILKKLSRNSCLKKYHICVIRLKEPFTFALAFEHAKTGIL